MTCRVSAREEVQGGLAKAVTVVPAAGQAGSGVVEFDGVVELAEDVGNRALHP